MLLDRRGAAAAGIEQGDAGADQLVEVLVSRDDHHLHASRRPLSGQCADDVVGLVALHANHRHTEGLEDLSDALQRAIEVLLQLLAKLLSSGLVGGIGSVAERLAHIVHPPKMVGAVLLAQARQEVGAPPGRGGVLAAFGGERPRNHGEEGAVDERIAVEEKQALARGGRGGGGRSVATGSRHRRIIDGKRKPRPRSGGGGGTNGAGGNKSGGRSPRGGPSRPASPLSPRHAP